MSAYTFSWFERETTPARRTLWDRLRFRHPTITLWRRRYVAIEQDADVVAFLWNDPRYAETVEPPLTVILAKQRNGPTGEVRVSYNKATGKFFNYTKLGLSA